MRTVWPETGFSENDVRALLMSRQFVFADCYTVTAPNGDRIRCTNSQEDLIVTPIGGGVKVTFTSTGLKVSGIRMNQGVGVDVDEQTAQFDFGTDILFQGIPIARALLWGRFDGGTVTRDRYFAQRWGAGNEPTEWMGGVRLFSGRIGELDEVGRSYCRLKVRSNLILLGLNMPQVLFQPSCKNAIYDLGCKLSRGAFEVQGNVGSGSTASVINWAGATAAMSLGTIYMEVAAGVTLVRTIREVDPGVKLLLSNAFEEVPTVGAAFATFQGCNRSLTRCQELSNDENFRGYPFVPTEETAL